MRLCLMSTNNTEQSPSGGVALVERIGFEVDAIDVFCGFGGSSQGIHRAGATVRVAANHNPLAIECHAANFPDTDHLRADLVDPDSGDYLDPADLPAARFAWFSPGCTHHSQANAKKLYQRGRQAMLPLFEDDFDEVAYARSERSRVTMSCVLRYAERRRPEIVVVENVVEVCHWGPGRDGSTFRWWLGELRTLGYEVEPCFFNSQFFPPCPQSRDRVYFVAWRKGNRRPDLDYRPTAYCISDACGGRHVQAVQSWKAATASWPLPRWGKYGAQYVYRCPECHAEVRPAAWPAYSAIDWTDLGTAIGERDKPLSATTVERIRRGLAKFRNGPAILIPAKAVRGSDPPATPLARTPEKDEALAVRGVVVATAHTHSPTAKAANRSRRLDEALFTVTADQVGQALVVKNNGAVAEAAYRAHHVADPFGSLTTQPAQALVTRGISLAAAGHVHERPGQTRARPLDAPMFTQHTSTAFGFAHNPFVSPALFSKINGGAEDTAWHDVSEPCNTVTARDTHGLMVLPWVEQFRSDPASVTEQLATVMTHLRHALASVEPVALDTVTSAELDAVRFRMFSPDPELRRIMAFGDEYVLLGTKTQMTAGLGNAVTPPVATWITERCLATLRDEPEARAA
jgi:site-specific DNA-cytosine methylase